MIKDKRSNYFVSIIFMMFLSILTIVFLVLDTGIPQYFNLLWVLPTTFLGISLLLIIIPIDIYSSLTGTIVTLLYFIRLVITPLVMNLGDYATIIEPYIFQNYSDIAIGLISCESIVIFLFMIFIFKKRKKTYKDIQKSEVIKNKIEKPSSKLWMIILLLCTYILIIIVSDETVLKSNFLFLIDMDQEYFALSDTSSGIGTLSMFVELMNSAFKIIQILLPPLILHKIIYSRLDRRIKYLLGFIVFALVLIVATEDRIDAIFAAIALLFTLRDSFGVRFKKYFKLWILLIILVGVIGLSIKSGAIDSGDSGVVFDFSESSKMITAYFSGVPTVATGISMIDHESGFNLLRIVPDVLYKIPYFAYVMNIFGGVKLIDSNSLFNIYITQSTGYNFGQILPTTVLGFEYFNIFAPILPCACIALALSFEQKIKKQCNMVSKNLHYWITIVLAVSPIIASSLLVVAKLSWYFVDMIIIRISRQKFKVKLK